MTVDERAAFESSDDEFDVWPEGKRSSEAAWTSAAELDLT